MKKIVLINLFLMCILLSTTACSQEKEKLYHTVIVPDSVKKMLESFIREKEGWEDVTGVYILNMVYKSDEEFKEGIYFFKLLNPHSEPSIFINYKGTIKIIPSDRIAVLLQNVLDFIKQTELSEEIQIEYFKALINSYED